MSPDDIELNQVEVALLRDVGDRAVYFTRGIYRLRKPGSRAVDGAAIQRLRSLALVRLTGNPRPVPPNRACELTERGRAVLARVDSVVP